MTKTDSYFVNLGHAIIDYLLKLVGGKPLRDKIGHVTYVIKMRLVMNSIMYYSAHLFTTIDDVYLILPIWLELIFENLLIYSNLEIKLS
jgi:hypothetical protein